MKHDDDEERPFYDRPGLTFDRLARLLVIAENVPGSDFCKNGAFGTATRLGMELGRTLEEAHADIFRRYEDYKSVFEADRAGFLRSVALLRQQYGDTRLRELYVLKP